jgi:hypothetical protein
MTLRCSDAERTPGVCDLHTIYFLSGVSYRFGGNMEDVYFLHTHECIPFTHLHVNPKALYQFYQVGPIHVQHLCGLSAVAIALLKGMLNKPTTKSIH